MLLVKYILILVGFGGLKMIERNDYRGLVFFFGAVGIWKWRAIFEWVQDRRWRDDFRTW